jgi:hypothetical protein
VQIVTKTLFLLLENKNSTQKKVFKTNQRDAQIADEMQRQLETKPEAILQFVLHVR